MYPLIFLLGQKIRVLNRALFLTLWCMFVLFCWDFTIMMSMFVLFCGDFFKNLIKLKKSVSEALLQIRGITAVFATEIYPSFG